jgi:hypothetical protein
MIETGFAYLRGPMAAYWEIGRQKKKNLAGIYPPPAPPPDSTTSGTSSAERRDATRLT